MRRQDNRPEPSTSPVAVGVSMSRRWKIATIVILLVPILILGAGGVLIGRKFGWSFAWRFVVGTTVGTKARALTSRTFERTPTRLERGRSLVGLARCFACHSETDPKTGIPLAGKMGAGKIRQSTEIPFPLIFPNITPDAETGASAWSDDMLGRAIREGIGHDGRPLVPIMRYENFKYLSDEDLASVVVYLRSIPPVHNSLPKMKVPFPYNLLVKAFPAPMAHPVPQPDPLKRGEYLIELGDCSSCHDGRDKEGHTLPYAGGEIIETSAGEKVAAANITPDPSGISYYDDALFIRTMRTGHVGARELSGAMPWRYFRDLTDEDLKAVFAYLQTLKPVRHRVDNTEPPTYCKICGHKHGNGALN
jgi:mono/diheme cytochrome c family protein